jgi:hypothetical protein
MVFVEERQKFLANIAELPKQNALFCLLFEESFYQKKDGLAETDSIYYYSVQAIKYESKNEFNTQYAKISKRKVSKGTVAPFVHDDFLIFILILGVLKFELEKDWLLGVIRTRAKNAITKTFENLLTGNNQSNDNLPSLVLVSLYLLDNSQITDKLLVEAYNSITNNKQICKDDFIRIVNYRAFDLIIQFKFPKDIDEMHKLLGFEKRFKKRIKVFSWVIYNLMLLAILYISYVVLQGLSEDLKSKINDVGVIMTIGGLGILGNFPKLNVKFQNLLLKALGYY